MVARPVSGHLLCSVFVTNQTKPCNRLRRSYTADMYLWSILIADDYPIVRRGLRKLLESRSGWRIIGEAVDGPDAIDKANLVQPDLLILDMTISRLDWRVVVARIRVTLPQTRILILAPYGDVETADQAVRLGANGFVVHSGSELELLAAVSDVLDGRVFIGAQTGSYRSSRSYLPNHERVLSPRLTLREQQVVRLLGDGMTSKQVATTLMISTRTAENHRARIMRKLELTSLADLIRYGVRHNMVPL
jgi:DNA-binding NarL/FixJ family response regulator